ncbi:MAG: Asp-tRNA(Asn)/Glu-tRNA(Gln) amidotransferase GatCAB subunit A [Magnetococcales bacterium]|nr:Asp-tRNA(Asn)/Glu-tRNA(Gln) amidotransferase GatCAB subunit A [Magnetococcales bacterium]PPR18797.1 MAG: Glutamyl-tRNA(Gln) amidotransferase subunit A [Pseudomonadota bacterium]
MELYELGLKEAANKIKNREITSVELTKALLDRIEERNGEINAYVTVDRDHALKMAEESDKRIREGNPRLIEGVPLGIKDLFCTKDVRTTACSHILDNFVPPYESTVTENLWKAGGVLLGKTNMDEFAMGSSNETSYFGPVKNPWDLTRTPGGSSGGSAAAVADYQCPVATGSDTGGSIRQPASFSGIVGIKPTYGRCSRFGMVAFASSLDQAGVFARNVEDAALMLRCMSGYDPKDSTSADRPIENYDEKLDQLEIKGMKIGLPKEYFIEGLDPTVKQIIDDAIKNFTDKGAEVVEISLPHTKYAVPAYYIVAPAEAAANLARYDGMRYGLRVEGDNLMDTYMKTRTEGFGTEVKRRIMIGNYTLSSGYYDAYYTKAQRVRALITKDFEEAFKEVDFIFTPTTPTPAFKIGGKVDDPVQMYLNDIFTVATNLAGLPGISVPAGKMDYEGANLPVGLQIIGPAFSEQNLLNAAYAHEKMTNFELLKA